MEEFIPPCSLGVSREENMARNDNEARAFRSSIDAILCFKKLDLDVFIIEVKVPCGEKDRIKTAKNLKKMMKRVLRDKLMMDEAKDLEFYGMLVRRNKVHNYCLSMPMFGFYCFT